MSVLYLITARGGSKGVPGKNLRKIGGHSLIAWKAHAAKQVISDEDRLVISTDCPIIKMEARVNQVEVPFTRPAELATDTASSADVIKHALASLDTQHDTVVLLEPSAPFTTPDHLVTALTMKQAKNAHLIVGMKHTSRTLRLLRSNPTMISSRPSL
jgi:CMP-N,N'-diacetyllegionaminic acid synthase